VAECCTIFSSRSRRPVRKLMDIPSCYRNRRQERGETGNEDVLM